MALAARDIPRSAEINALTAELVSGGTARAEALFRKAGSVAPHMVWSPLTSQIGTSVLREFAAICDDMSGVGGLIARETFDLARFGTMRDWLMEMRIEPATGLIRYDHYGQEIARAYGKNMTGATTLDFPGHIGSFLTATYHAVIVRRQRALTLHQPPDQVFVTTWHRLIVPIETNGEIDGFIAINMPENELKAGLEIMPLPVLILDAGRIVRYANKSARQTFDSGRHGPWDRNLFDYAGVDLDIDQSPEEILSRGIAQSRTCRHVAHQRIGSLEATISAARHRDAVFFVLMLQPRGD